MSNKHNKEEKLKCIKKRIKWFTLVELIVVITILAILGTIGFISFQNYTRNSRDSVRIADINSIKKNLELFITDKWFYPTPDNWDYITYKWWVAWSQWTVWDNVIINLWRLNKKPTDPLTGNEYTYSVANNKVEYQIWAILEWGWSLSYNLPLLPEQANASTDKTALAMVTGTYNEKIIKVSTGSMYYILAVPSIINANLYDTDLQSIIDNRELVYNNYSNIPDSYKNLWYTMTGWFDFIPSWDIEIYSWSTDTTLTEDADKITFINNLKQVYDWTILNQDPIYTEIMNLDTTNNSIWAIALVDTYITNNVWWLSWESSTTIAYSCAQEPSYIWAIFTTLSPTLINQEWQWIDDTLPCYYTCWEWKVLVWEECVQETCSWTTPDWTTKISNATSAAWWTWNYDTTPWLCTYSCNTNYHTIDWWNTCILNTYTITFNINGGTSWTMSNQTIATDASANLTTNAFVKTWYTFAWWATSPTWAVVYVNGASYTMWTNNVTLYAKWTAINSIASCPFAWQIWVAISTYTWCNTADIIVCSGVWTWYTLSACNIWTTTAWTSATSYWQYFQWWNNFWSLIWWTTSTSQVNASTYWPWNYYSSSPNFIMWFSDWTNPQNNNLWWDTLDNTTTRQWPCATWYHIPNQSEWAWVVSAGWWGTSWLNMSNALKLPKAWLRNRSWAWAFEVGISWHYWSTTPYLTNANRLNFTDTTLLVNNFGRWHGFPIRCFKN